MIDKLIAALAGVFFACIMSIPVAIKFITVGPTKMLTKRKNGPQPSQLNDIKYGEHKYIRLKSVKLHYVISGLENAPLMLMLHGFPEIWYSWRHQITAFQDRYRVVAIDMRGYGESERPERTEDYKMDLLVEDIKLFLKAINYKTCILVAHDWGGTVAWAFANQYPEMVEKLIMMNMCPLPVWRNGFMSNIKQFFCSGYIFVFFIPFLPEFVCGLGDCGALDGAFSDIVAGKKTASLTDKDVECYKYYFRQDGIPPKDQRGKHLVRPHRIPDTETEKVKNHIASFRGCLSHYSQEKSRKLYLPDDLNISKMYALFLDCHPESNIKYEAYRTIFNGHFNISFGYPRSNTCSKCDEFIVKIQFIDSQLQSAPDNAALLKQKGEINSEKEIHQRKAEVFYQRKRGSKQKAQANSDVLSVAFDFQKDLYCPNKSTNDIYYRRQLSVHSFNIHELGTDSVYLFVYDQTIGKKGSDDVTSMLYYYISNFVPATVRNIEFFCDSCCGQNKNYTVIRFIYYIVHVICRFDSVRVTFPERGHSYLECDRDLVAVNKKYDAETPSDWMKAFREARKNPSPYNVIEMDRNKFLCFSSFLRPMFKATCPFPTRPIKEMEINVLSPSLVKFRNNWHGLMDTSVVVPRSARNQKKLIEISQSVPKPLYAEQLKISTAKYQDLQVLKRFCCPSNHAFFYSLPSDNALYDMLHENEDSDYEE